MNRRDVLKSTAILAAPSSALAVDGYLWRTSVKLCDYADELVAAKWFSMQWSHDALAVASANSPAQLPIDVGHKSQAGLPEHQIDHVIGRCGVEARADGLYVTGVCWLGGRVPIAAIVHRYLTPAVTVQQTPQGSLLLPRPTKFIGFGLTSCPVSGFLPIDWSER